MALFMCICLKDDYIRLYVYYQKSNSPSHFAREFPIIIPENVKAML